MTLTSDKEKVIRGDIIMKMNSQNEGLNENVARIETEKNNVDDALMRDLKCETCIYSEQCDGWEYAPFCMAEL